MTAVDPSTGEVLEESDHMKNVRAIKAAFEGENASKWVAGDVALREVPMGRDGENTGAYTALKRLADEAKVDFNALRTRRDVAASWPAPTRVGAASWSAHRELMGHPDRARVLAENPHWTVNDVRQFLKRQPANYAKPKRRGDDPEEWTPEQWQDFDREVTSACKLVLTALNTWHRGLYEPSVAAVAQLALIKPQDLDAELAQLLNG